MASALKGPTVDPTNQSLPRQIAFKLLDICWEVLFEQIGRTPTRDEMAELAETMASNLLGHMYLDYRAGEGGPEAAEKWLRRALAMVPAVVRSAGSDAFLKIDLAAKEVPNRMMKHAEEAQEHAVATPPSCACEKPEGQCLACRTHLAERLQGAYEAITSLLKYKETKDPCPVCAVTEFDAAMAQSVPVFGKCLDGMDKAAGIKFAQDLFGTLSTMAAMKGLKEMPLTVKACQDLFTAKGLEPA